VVWHEDFEAGSGGGNNGALQRLQEPGSMALVTEKPSQSCGAASMRLIAGGSTASDDATDLLQEVAQPDGSGFDELYVRWYVQVSGWRSVASHWPLVGRLQPAE